MRLNVHWTHCHRFRNPWIPVSELRHSTRSVSIYLQGYRSLTPSLKSLKKNLPNFESIPVFVFHFNAPWSQIQVRNFKKKFANLKLIELHPKIPEGIKEEDLFWHRRNDYAQKFGPERLGYLHMCHIASDVGALPEVNSFDLALQIDDDIEMLRPPDEDIFRKVEDSPGFIGTSHVYSHVHQKNLDTRQELFNFTLKYMATRKISPKNLRFAEIVERSDEESFHRMEWTSCNFNIYKMSEFQLPRWREWISAVKSFGGSYRYRWGDQEIIGIYGYMFFDEPFVNLRLEDQGVLTPKRRWLLREIIKKRGNVIRG